jgi:hypothetical protein
VKFHVTDKTIKKYNMKKTFLLLCSLVLFAGVKAQQPKTKKTEVIGYREGHSPESKKQQKQAGSNTPAFPKPVDSVQHSAKMKSATGNQTFPKPIDSVRIKAPVGRQKTTEKNVKAVTQFIKG